MTWRRRTAGKERWVAERIDRRERELPRWLNAALVFGTFAAVAALEMRRPLRKSREPKLVHDLRNLAASALAAATVAVAEKPVVAPLALSVVRQRLGLLQLVWLPLAAELLLSVLLLDYTLFIWHYLTHKIPLLWRFHQAHHLDHDLDATTALRFHPGELLLSVPWRAAQVRLLGISPLGLSLWQTLTLMAILFHHANLRLPFRLERLLCRLLVTPRMHGIHHSVLRAEADANWSTIFSWPDYLHGTARLNVPQQAITIGAPGCRNMVPAGLGEYLMVPFRPRQQGSDPTRPPISIPATILAD